MESCDEVRCDYPISPEVNDTVCQTKSIQGDIGGSGNLYYIDPAGYLYYIDYYGTTEWVRDPTKPRPQPYVRLQTGKHGKVQPMTRFTSILKLIPSQYQGSWEDYPEYWLSIVQGKVQSHTVKPLEAHEHRHHRYYCL